MRNPNESRPLNAKNNIYKRKLATVEISQKKLNQSEQNWFSKLSEAFNHQNGVLTLKQVRILDNLITKVKSKPKAQKPVLPNVDLVKLRKTLKLNNL